jgi:hypothetical protein
MGRLTLRYAWNTDFDPAQSFYSEEEGRLAVSVAAGGFSGSVSVESRAKDVRDFGESLSTYPIRQDAPLSAFWGYEGHRARVAVRSVKGTGSLVARVEIESVAAAEGAPAPDAVRVSFVTDYAQVEAFRRSIASMMDGKAKEAVLSGH